jgi:hypothetical protein
MPESRPAPRPWRCLLLVPVLTALACDPPPTSIPPGPTPIVAGPVVERPIPPPTPVTTVEMGDAGPPAELPPEPEAEPEAGGGTLTRDGGACERAIECQSGICEGQGCGADRKGVCMSRNRACTRDIRTFCGCDGKTFQGSSSCPGQRFASRGKCK